MNQYVDFDTHVYEPIEVFHDYLDPKFRDRAPKLFKGADGRLMLQMAEHVYPKVPAHPGFYNIYGEESKVDRSGNDPHARTRQSSSNNGANESRQRVMTRDSFAAIMQREMVVIFYL